MNNVKIKVDATQLEEALKKAKELKTLLEEVHVLIRSLSETPFDTNRKDD